MPFTFLKYIRFAVMKSSMLDKYLTGIINCIQFTLVQAFVEGRLT